MTASTTKAARGRRGRARRRIGLALAACTALAALPAFSQTSASYRLTEHSANCGGTPAGGVLPASAGYTLGLATVCEAATESAGAASASYSVTAGFPAPYPPPGEVLGLVLTDAQTVTWDAAPSAGRYNVYRDLLTTLSGLGYGTCALQDVPDTSVLDLDVPPAADGYFYLVTVENRLAQEGTKGQDSSGTERGGAACP